MSDITRHRGDTRRIQRTVKIDGVATNITGWTFMLTINREEDPDDTSEEVAQIAGVIVVAGDGTVKFTPNLADVDWVGVYFYDIEAVDADGGVSTLDKGRWTHPQDITKSDEEFEWTPLTAPSDDDPYVGDGSVDLRAYMSHEDDTYDVTYQTRDTRRVLRVASLQDASYHSTEFTPIGPAFPRDRFPTSGFEFKVTLYVNLAFVWLGAIDRLWSMSVEINADTRGAIASDGYCAIVADGVDYREVTTTPMSVSGWTAAEWLVMGIRFAADGKLYAMAKKEADPDDWQLLTTDLWPASVPLLLTPGMLLRRKDPEDAASLIDFWKYEWRRLS